MKRVEKFVKDNKYEIIEAMAFATVTVGVYTFVCRKAGYRMVKPIRVDEKYVYVRAISGLNLKCPINP